MLSGALHVDDANGYVLVESVQRFNFLAVYLLLKYEAIVSIDNNRPLVVAAQKGSLERGPWCSSVAAPILPPEAACRCVERPWGDTT